MENRNLILKQKQFRPGTLAIASLVLLLGLLILPSSAQINSQLKHIYISGQLTSSNTGAPIADHQIYITSDSLVNGGFGYYATTKTDVNGFYWDTLVTSTTDGIIKIYLYDFEQVQIELDRYYRFVWENEYMMFADFAIFNPDANTELQANFSTYTDPLDENPLLVIFEDESIGTSVKSWIWDFGDGDSSEVQDPEHAYSHSGVYMVTLTINALPGFQGFESSTITKQVQVGLREYHHLGGHVFAEYFPIDLGLAYLYTYDDENNLIALDTTEIDQLGYYYFYEVPVGKYMTKARLQESAELYGKFMPTYFRNAYDWNDAEEIVIGSGDNWECDIWLRQSAGMDLGEGTILGQITYDTSLFSRNPIPAEDIEIVLLDTQGDFLTCRLSDTEGHFNFGNIPYGTYQLFPDVAGISTTPMYVTISEEKPLADDLNMVIYPGEITFSVQENISAFLENTVLLYPNPVNDQARIALEVKNSSLLTVKVTDLSGRIVYASHTQLDKGSQEIILPVQDLPAGLYQVLLIPEDNVMMSGKFLKSK
jgi:hypothetical protein